jgi:hypothetical protein
MAVQKRRNEVTSNVGFAARYRLGRSARVVSPVPRRRLAARQKTGESMDHEQLRRETEDLKSYLTPDPSPEIATAIYVIAGVMANAQQDTMGNRIIATETLVKELVGKGVTATIARDAIHFAGAKDIVRRASYDGEYPTIIQDTITLRQIGCGQYADWLGDQPEVVDASSHCLPQNVDGMSDADKCLVLEHIKQEAGRESDQAKGKPNETDKNADSPKRRWDKSSADREVAKYVIDRQATYASLMPKCKSGDATAIKQAQMMFGRNTLAKQLGIPGGTISKTDQWEKIKRELCLGSEQKSTSGLRHAGNKIGMEIAEEQISQPNNKSTPQSPVYDDVVRRETIDLLQANLPETDAQQITTRLISGEISDGDARLMLTSYEDGQASLTADKKAKHHPKRSNRKSDQ